jgi:hypothetical protein
VINVKEDSREEGPGTKNSALLSLSCSPEAALVENEWRLLVIWECALRGPQRRPVADVFDEIVRWFSTDEADGVIGG